MKYIEYVKREFSRPEFPAFTVADVRLSLEGKGLSDAYLNLMLHNLFKSGKAWKITRGIYTFHNDVAVVGFAYRPFYYGMESALALRGFSDQGVNLVVMTARNVRTGVRSFIGRNYRVHRIAKDRMFGYSLLKYGGYWMPVSDAEKTVIDMIESGDHIAESAMAAIKKVLNKKKLAAYLKRCSSETEANVMHATGIKRFE